MISHAINSGPLNTVPFPGSEEGRSLIELIGVVVVTCSISSIKVRSTCSAKTTISATTSSISAKSRMQLGAAVTPSATWSVSGITRIRVVADPLVAGATARSGAQVLARVAASASCSATVSTTAYNHAFRGASATCEGLGSIGGRKYGYRAAQITVSAEGTVNALRKTPIAVNAQCIAYGEATMAFAYRMPAYLLTKATVTADTRRNTMIGASGSASAVVSANLAFARMAYPEPSTASAICSSGSIGLVHIFATGAMSASVEAVIIIKHGPPASTAATATADVFATDLAIAAPAPEERRMLVAAEDRRMEVTA